MGETTGNVLEYINDNYIVFLDEANKIKLRMEAILNSNELVIKDLIDKKKKVPYVLENMYNYEDIFSKLTKYQNIYLEKQDATSEKNNVFYFKYNDLKEIDDIFTKKIDEEKKKYVRPKRRLSKEFREGQTVIFSDLKVGDYIVHRTSGIGQFIGVNTIKADGVIKDYIKIRYKDDDILYIPTDALDSVRKYMGEKMKLQN